MYLTSAGMVCSVGLSADAACAALRAGIDKFDELPYHDSRGEPIIGASVPGIDSPLPPHARLTELLAVALGDCLGSRGTSGLENIPLLVGLAELDRPGCAAPEIGESMIPDVERKLKVRCHPYLSRTFSHGHTAGFHALREARQLFQTAGVPACLVCGVDSYLNVDALVWLKRHGRLKTPDNSNGVIPGEAAAAVLLQPQLRPGASVGVEILGLGFAHETAGVLSEEPLLGHGLAQAGRAALAEAKKQMHEIDYRLSDVTGESYGFREQALVLAKLLKRSREKIPIWHCAEAIGDTGAAAGICHLVMAFQAWSKGYAPGKLALCCASAVAGERAVAVLQQHGV